MKFGKIYEYINRFQKRQRKPRLTYRIYRNVVLDRGKPQEAINGDINNKDMESIEKIMNANAAKRRNGWKQLKTEYMKLTKKQRKALTAIAIIAVVLLLGIAGRVDYTDTVILHMPQSTYDEIKDTLGEGASEYDIAKYYKKNYR